MNCIRNVTSDLLWIGGNDRRLDKFENIYPLANGVCFNSYLLLDEKTVVFDTVDHAISNRFLENVEAGLAGRGLDYLVVNHVEPDHAGTIKTLMEQYPEAKMVCNVKIQTMLHQFFQCDWSQRMHIVKEGDILDTGRHKLTFVMAPMVHWPEVMVTYDTTDHILFSADAFGTFGALSGHLFADQYDFNSKWLPEARRYYTNIVGKYGAQVQSLLKKASGLQLDIICPLHGPMWRNNMDWIMDKYQKWSTYTPEEEGVVIVYGSIYGNTENAAEILAHELSKQGIKNVFLFDVSVTHHSEILAQCFRFSHLVFAAATYNNDVFTYMKNFLEDLKSHNLQKRTVAFMENGSWAPISGKRMAEIVGGMKDMTILENPVTIKSSVKAPQVEAISTLAQTISDSIKQL